MSSRAIRKSLIGTRWAPSQPITLPCRIRSFATSPINPPESLPIGTPPTSISHDTKARGTDSSVPRDIAIAKPQDRSRLIPGYDELREHKPAVPKRHPIDKPLRPARDNALDPTVKQLLPLLRSQPPFYGQIYIQGKSYLVTEGDKVRLPFEMHGVQMGDTLRLDRATIIGSRDYTLKAGTNEKGQKKKFLDERLFTCRARVLGVVQEPMRVKIKKKRRNRHAKHVYDKLSFTVLRISELTVHDAPLEATDELAKLSNASA